MWTDLWFPLRKSSSSDSQGSQGPDGASCPFVLSLQFVLMIAGCQPVHRIRMRSPSILCNSSRWIVFYANTCINCEVCALSLKAPTLTMEGGRLKRSLQLVPGRDFEIVPEPVWRALYHWYGANLSLPRPVSVKSTPTQQFNECDCKCDVSNTNITVYFTGAMLTFFLFASFFCNKSNRADEHHTANVSRLWKRFDLAWKQMSSHTRILFKDSIKRKIRHRFIKYFQNAGG